MSKTRIPKMNPEVYQRIMETSEKGEDIGPVYRSAAWNEINRLRGLNKLSKPDTLKLSNLLTIAGEPRGGTPLPTSNPFTLGSGGATLTTEPILTRSKTATPQLTSNGTPPPLLTAPPNRTGLTGTTVPSAQHPTFGPTETPEVVNPFASFDARPDAQGANLQAVQEELDPEADDDDWLSTDEEGEYYAQRIPTAPATKQQKRAAATRTTRETIDQLRMQGFSGVGLTPKVYQHLLRKWIRGARGEKLEKYKFGALEDINYLKGLGFRNAKQNTHLINLLRMFPEYRNAVEGVTPEQYGRRADRLEERAERERHPPPEENLNLGGNFIQQEMADQPAQPAAGNPYSYRLSYNPNLDNVDNYGLSIPTNLTNAFNAPVQRVQPTGIQRHLGAAGARAFTKQAVPDYAEGYQHQGYSSTMNELGKTLGLADNTQTLAGMLPERYLSNQIGARRLDRSFYNPDDHPEDRTVATPTANEYALAEKLKLAGRPIPDSVAGRTKRRVVAGNVLPPSQAQRRKLRDDRAEARIQAKNAYTTAMGDEYGLASAATEKIRRYNRAKRHEKAANKTYWAGDHWERYGDQGVRQITALRNVRNQLPASLTKPEYLPYLRNPDVKGITINETNKFPEAIRDAEGLYARKMQPREANIIGYSWQTLPVELRNQYMMTFAELIGTLNAHPVYDERLLTVESAKYVFPEDDFDIRMINFDRNDLTPAVCVVATKRWMRYKGMELPAGSIVAVGGWTIANASESYTDKQFKDILYYQAYPTKQSRKNNPRTLYINSIFGDPKTKRENSRNLKFIVDNIRLIIQQKQYSVPFHRAFLHL